MAMAVAHEQQQRAVATTSPPPPLLRVLDTTLVPPSPSFGPVPQERSLPLTFFDLIWLRLPPVERLFLYRLAPDADVPAILTNLKDALSHAIRAFYPLVGRLRLTPGTSDRYELHYRPGDGVAFTVAEYDGGADGVDGLATDEPREAARMAPLVPSLPAGGDVLALQATLLLPARRGLAIGVAVHHAAVDGASSTHFLHTWAAAARARTVVPPVIDRSLLPDAFFQAASTTNEMELVEMPAGQLLATFTLSKDAVQRVKGVVATVAARRGVAPPRCTSLVATLGFVWSCYQRAKEAPSSTALTASTSGDDNRTCLLFPVDHRARMKPPLPDKYLGNCVGPAFALARKDELAAGGAGGLLSACAAIAAGIDEAVSGVGTASMDTWADRAKEVAGAMSVLSVAGSPRFRVYELDLGFGRPAKVDMVSVARTGAVAVAESRRGAGGMEVGVSLPPDGLGRFRTCFADAVAGLHAQS
ncbi:Phenolic glucoside malonyltransferase 2 [Dichanthelium oligosanthes]|uniref:Phenolic glucoside malonyltransferase 2 n=1 Tax=Dichanthelium oligosanthes TaxID=888268 RepID=A0A1E5V3B7_9POAL|nr:Phenolic glucoside malonyltransferase 2 [Dichanthelium oligosanthes]